MQAEMIKIVLNTVDSEEMANLKELQKLEELEKRDKIIEKEENKKRNN